VDITLAHPGVMAVVTTTAPLTSSLRSAALRAIRAGAVTRPALVATPTRRPLAISLVCLWASLAANIDGGGLVAGRYSGGEYECCVSQRLRRRLTWLKKSHCKTLRAHSSSSSQVRYITSAGSRTICRVASSSPISRLRRLISGIARLSSHRASSRTLDHRSAADQALTRIRQKGDSASSPSCVQ
jgi:hypothetical protein